MGTSAALIAFFLATVLAAAALTWAFSLRRQVQQIRGTALSLDAKYQDFLSCSADWYWETDADGRFLRFERGPQSAVPDVDGVDRLPYGKRRQDLTADDTDQAHWRRHAEDIAAGRPFDNFLYSVRRSNGTLAYVRSSGRPVLDGDGKVIGWRGAASNLTRLRQREMELARQTALLRLTIDNVASSVLLVDEDLKIRHWNRLLHGIFDLPTGIIKPGMPYADLVRYFAKRGDYGPGEPGTIVQQQMTSLPPNGPERIEWTILSDKIIETYRRFTPGLGFVFTHIDITHRKRSEEKMRTAMEEAFAANRAKTVFLANMSHELRTPLNAVIGFAEIMEGQLFGPIGNPRYLDYARDIRESGAHLLEVINDILDLSKIESGKVEMNEEELDLVRIIQSVVRLLQHRAARAGLALHTDLPPAMPSLYADGRLLRQILLNLLSNAVKFTDAGGSVTISASLEEGGGLALRVADTGIGMDPAEVPIALTPFRQLDNSLSRKFQGTGLGLPLVKSLIELHGGTLEIETALNVGTTITVHLPAERVVSRPNLLTAAP
ncbi:ATP-binding protein [Elstera cyanobacteriorum]|uniref:ATP-binding protein n=1 Tax=Elstera cyanobacteriorum TaxID=2022747 RepID=UPI002356E558|nr:ATP-binding protein [Elstera cyanobacteriorum]MCK6443881.1 ATP-binding protein [Elstera cyanobacteriorum]